MISVISTQQYCCEDISHIENFDKAVLDADEIWTVHHRLEIQKDYTLSVDELKKMGMYFRRPACELIFLTQREHAKIHQEARTDGFTSTLASIGGKNGTGEAKSRHKGKFGWTDGVHNVYAFECPGEGWRRGQTRSVVASKASRANRRAK